jgi:hypothetical protein
MPCLADAALRGRLTHLDLHIINPLEFQQTGACVVDDSVALALGKARQIQTDDGPRRRHTNLIKPTKVKKRAVATCITEVAERLSGLFR